MGALFLSIRIAERDIRLEVNEETKITLGRSDKCDIVINSKAVSARHLEVNWDGRKLTIRDLKSTHGTKIMPGGAPFEKKVFPPVPTELSLVIAGLPITVSWGLSGFDDEKTTFSEAESPTIKLDKTQVESLDKTFVENEQKKGASEEVDPLDELFKEKEKLTPEIKKKASKKPVQPYQKANTPIYARNSHATALLFSLISAFSLFYFWEKSYFSSLLHVDKNLLLSGGALDYYVLFVLLLKQVWIVFAIVFLIGFLVCYKLRPNFIEQSKAFSSRFFSYSHMPFICFFVFLVALLWPLLKVSSYQVPLDKYSSIHQMLEIEASDSGAETKSRSYFDLAKPLEGSSYLYLKLLNIRFSRIYSECAKEKNQEWEQKRMCLVLFLAASIETFDEVKPALLSEIAVRFSLLLALDGVIRVVRVEGVDSQAISFFVNALDAIGLSKEKTKINAMIYQDGKSKETILIDLIRLRRQLDQRIVTRQKELGYPRAFQLTPFNPLNVGL